MYRRLGGLGHGLVALLDPLAAIRARARNVVADVLEDALPRRQLMIRTLLELVDVDLLVWRRRLIVITQHGVRLKADRWKPVGEAIYVARVLIRLQVIRAGSHNIRLRARVVVLFELRFASSLQLLDRLLDKDRCGRLLWQQVRTRLIQVRKLLDLFIHVVVIFLFFEILGNVHSWRRLAREPLGCLLLFRELGSLQFSQEVLLLVL